MDVLKPCATADLTSMTMEQRNNLIATFSDESVECTPTKAPVTKYMQKVALVLEKMHHCLRRRAEAGEWGGLAAEEVPLHLLCEDASDVAET